MGHSSGGSSDPRTNHDANEEGIMNLAQLTKDILETFVLLDLQIDEDIDTQTAFRILETLEVLDNQLGNLALLVGLLKAKVR